MRHHLYATGLAAAMLLAAAPASAATVSMTGHVPTICQLADSRAFSFATQQMTATLTIFCNSANGAIVSASLLSGDEEGYVFTSGATTLALRPGDTVDLISLNTAYHGERSINIAPVNGNADPGAQAETPVVMFEILAE
jgi:hypothetical protein